MLARVTVWVFYAIVFFMLGAWLGPKSGVIERQVQNLWSWGYHQVADSRPATPEPRATLADARDAYQRGDIAAAIAAYRSAIAANPVDLETRGELGNVLYGAGRLEEAATVYSDVAAALADRGDREAARHLEPAIRRGNPALADGLLRRLGS